MSWIFDFFLFEDNKTPEARFKEVSQSHKESIERHLQDQFDNNDSSEEEDEIGDNIIQTVFKGYSTIGTYFKEFSNLID